MDKTIDDIKREHHNSSRYPLIKGYDTYKRFYKMRGFLIIIFFFIMILYVLNDIHDQMLFVGSTTFLIFISMLYLYDFSNSIILRVIITVPIALLFDHLKSIPFMGLKLLGRTNLAIEYTILAFFFAFYCDGFRKLLNFNSTRFMEGFNTLKEFLRIDILRIPFYFIILLGGSFSFYYSPMLVYQFQLPPKFVGPVHDEDLILLYHNINGTISDASSNTISYSYFAVYGLKDMGANFSSPKSTISDPNMFTISIYNFTSTSQNRIEIVASNMQKEYVGFYVNLGDDPMFDYEGMEEAQKKMDEAIIKMLTEGVTRFQVSCKGDNFLIVYDDRSNFTDDMLEGVILDLGC